MQLSADCPPTRPQTPQGGTFALRSTLAGPHRQARSRAAEHVLASASAPSGRRPAKLNDRGLSDQLNRRIRIDYR